MTIFLIMIAYILGIIWGLYIKSIVPFFILIVIFILFKTIKKLNRYINVLIPNKKLILIISIFLISYSYILSLENSFDNKYLDIQENIKVEAIVVSNAKEKEYKDVFKIKVETINGSTKYKGTYLQLSIKNNKSDIEYGDKITFTGEFKQGEQQRNYKGYNYRQYLKTNKIYGLVTTNKIEKIEKEQYNKILIFINKLSNKIVNNSNEILDEEQASLLTGILIGNKDNLSIKIEESFRDSNLSHMLAVSGAHVTYVILGITFILQKSKIHKRISKIVTIVLLMFFVILTGATASVTRACIMAIYILLGSLIYRKANILASISISLIIILAINPYKILDVGLQLSYGGTIGIILFNKILVERIKLPEIKNSILSKVINSIKEMLIVSVSANLIIFPIMAIHYNTISLTFFISNILAGPILGIIIILGFITIFISFISIEISKIISIILGLFLKLLVLIANISSNLPFSKIYVKTPSILFIVMYYIILALILYKFKRKNKRRTEKIILRKLKDKITRRKIIAITIIIVLVFQIIKILPSDLKIYFIDVGQGDSTLIVTPNHKTILIDGGGSLDNDVYDVGKNTLIPYLLDRGTTRLDYIIISHFDSDHVGGILSIIKELKVKKIIISKQGEDSENYKEFLKIVKEKRISVQVVKAGDVLKIEKNINLEILWPQDNLILENILNNNSIVMRLNYINFSMLFTGDIEQIAEEEIVKKYMNTNKLNSTIIKIAHHGSKTSSIQEFLSLVKPKIALIGVGKDNNFGHPNFEVLERLQNMNCKILRTDENGEITIVVNSKARIKTNVQQKKIKNKLVLLDSS